MTYKTFIAVLLAVFAGSILANSYINYTNTHVLMVVRDIRNGETGKSDPVYKQIIRMDVPFHDASSEYQVYLISSDVKKDASGAWREEASQLSDQGDDFVVTKFETSNVRLQYYMICTKDGMVTAKQVRDSMWGHHMDNSYYFEVGEYLPSLFVIGCR